MIEHLGNKSGVPRIEICVSHEAVGISVILHDLCMSVKTHSCFTSAPCDLLLKRNLSLERHHNACTTFP